MTNNLDIIIRTVGNRSLYRSIYENIDSETHHRTIGGAVRRVKQINASEKTWVKTVGMWGTVDVEINGVKLDDVDAMWLTDADQNDDDYQLRWRWESAIKESVS